MSSRAMKRLLAERQKEQDLMATRVLGDQAEDDSEGEDNKPTRNVNAFAMLVGDDDDMVDDEEEVEEEEQNKEAKSTQSTAKSSKSKKKKRKNKKKTDSPTNVNAVVDKQTDGDAIDVEEERILAEFAEKAKKEAIELEQQEILKANAVNVLQKFGDLMSITKQKCDPDLEMRRIFGREVMAAAAAEEGGNQQMARPGRRARRGQQVASTHRSRGGPLLRQTWLSRPKDNWPPSIRKGISMVYDEDGRTSVDGTRKFRFEHSRDYQDIQLYFYDAVDSMNPQNIAAILNLDPYHADALITLSDICKHQGDIQMASDFIERALFAFERAFHPTINLADPDFRVDYAWLENRSFFLAIARHIDFMGRRGAWRTALEFCKLLFILDPEMDPLAALLELDYLAIRANEFEWLLNFWLYYEGNKNLSLLPNFAYSIPLARFMNTQHEHRVTEAMVKQAVGLYKNMDEDAMKLNTVLEPLYTASMDLIRAMTIFPEVVVALQPKAAISLPAEAMSHEHFAALDGRTSVGVSKTLKCLAQLYAERTYALWKSDVIVLWLSECMKAAVWDVEQGMAADAEPLREAYRGNMPKNIQRHIIVADIGSVRALMPLNLPDNVMAYDPIPPTNSRSSADYPKQILERRRNQADETGDSSNPLMVLLRSLMPSYHVEGQHPVEAQIERQGRLQELHQRAGGNRRPHQPVRNADGVLDLDHPDNPILEEVNEEEQVNAVNHLRQLLGDMGIFTGENRPIDNESDDDDDDEIVVDDAPEEAQ
eukprot:Clim_evm12s217 gene=Clim_evmTU12s217